MSMTPEERKNYEEQSKENLKKAKAKNNQIGCITLVALIVIIIIAISTCSRNNGTTSTSDSDISIATPIPAKPDLELLSQKSTGDEYFRYITGQVKNNTSKEYSYAQITFNLYDKSGAQIGSAMDNINNLEPGGVWKYKAMITEEGATNFKFKELTGF